MVEKTQDSINIVQRRDFLRAHSNYHSKVHFVYDKLTLNMFVNYEKIDLEGNPIRDKISDEKLSSSAHIIVSAQHNEKVNEESSSETDAEEDRKKTPNSDISHVLESEDETCLPEFIHRYSVEIISEYKD